MGAPNIFFTMLALSVSLIGFVFGNSLFNDEDTSDIRQCITQDCYAIMEAAKDYFSEPALLGGEGRRYQHFGTAPCRMQETETGYFGDTEIARFIVRGNAERFTVTGMSKADIRKTVVLTFFKNRPDGRHYSLLTSNWE